MTELYLPSLPEFEIKNSLQHLDDAYEHHNKYSESENEIVVTMSYGVLDVDFLINTYLVIESFETNINDNPQDNIERDFKYLQVKDTPIVAMRSDIDIVEGQRLKLTEKQRADLNEILKGKMEVVV